MYGDRKYITMLVAYARHVDLGQHCSLHAPPSKFKSGSLLPVDVSSTESRKSLRHDSEISTFGYQLLQRMELKGNLKPKTISSNSIHQELKKSLSVSFQYCFVENQLMAPGNTLLTLFLMIMITVFLAKAQGQVKGLWPSYFPDDTVPPYHQQPGCTTITPLPKANITEGLLNSILPDMNTYWPDLRSDPDLTQQQGNVNLWQYQWERHGMCYIYPDIPLIYFRAAMNIIKKFNLLQILQTGGIDHDNQRYNGSLISRVLTAGIGAPPQIVCNRDAQRNLQLSAIHICITRHGHVLPCLYAFTNCPNGEEIRFPTP
ncbi:ribonuclease 1-like [Tripterygium wilfordii]|uniref:ribonuclease 1-like n=1 Tax=Tripterygium wilfordii TaxID=458696 RepID=UPI0018F85F2F|nr:ribonuclease 1-like [Tripterygium wilfordii]